MITKDEVLNSLKCSLCEKIGIVLTFENGNKCCLLCVNELKNFVMYAPMPMQEQPGNYFPKIGAKNDN